MWAVQRNSMTEGCRRCAEIQKMVWRRMACTKVDNEDWKSVKNFAQDWHWLKKIKWREKIKNLHVKVVSAVRTGKINKGKYLKAVLFSEIHGGVLGKKITQGSSREHFFPIRGHPALEGYLVNSLWLACLLPIYLFFRRWQNTRSRKKIQFLLKFFLT